MLNINKLNKAIVSDKHNYINDDLIVNEHWIIKGANKEDFNKTTINKINKLFKPLTKEIEESLMDSYSLDKEEFEQSELIIMPYLYTYLHKSNDIENIVFCSLKHKCHITLNRRYYDLVNRKNTTIYINKENPNFKMIYFVSNSDENKYIGIMPTIIPEMEYVKSAEELSKILGY